jgi:hypothetical protein
MCGKGVRVRVVAVALVWLAVARRSAADAPPPHIPKRVYRAPNGQWYAPAGVPVKLSFELSTASEPGDSGGGEADKPPVVLREGPSDLSFGGMRVPVIADGTPPKTTLEVVDTPSIVVEDTGKRILGREPKFHMTASDALSGVSRTYVSIDGAKFEPLQSEGPSVRSEGPHRIRYFSVDHVGNAEPPQEFAFDLDSSAPETEMTITGPHTADVAGAGTSIVLSATDRSSGVQQIRMRMDDAAEQAYTAPILLDALPEGPHRLRYAAVDKVRNEEGEHTFAFTVDRQSPHIELSIAGTVYRDSGVRYVPPSAEISLAAADTVAGNLPVRYRYAGAKTSTVYSKPFRLPEEGGLQRLRLESEDPVANLQSTLVDDIYVDRTPPRTEASFSRPYFQRAGETVLNPRSLIALVASDLESGVAEIRYAIDEGEEQVYKAPFSIAAEGSHRVHVFAADHVGNRETPHEFRVLIERPTGTAPVPVLDAKRWYQHPSQGLMGPVGLPFELRISESPDEKGGTFLLSAGPQPAGPIAFSTPGKNTLSLAISPKPEDFAILIDGTAPKSHLEATGATRVDSGGTTYFGPGLKLTLQSEDTPPGPVSGVWKTLYSLNGAPFATYTNTIDTFRRDGEYTFRYYALDNVGNAETAQSLVFMVDVSAPKTQLALKGPHRASTITPATRFELSAMDNLSGVADVLVVVDGAKPFSYSAPFTLASPADGRHSVRYYAVDTVGNREEEHALTFTMQRTVPAPSFELSGQYIARGNTIFVTPGTTVRFKAEEGLRVQYELDGETARTYSVPVAAPASGDHRLTFRAVDDLGNASASRTLNLLSDQNAPTSSLRFEGPAIERESELLIGGNTRCVLAAGAGRIGPSRIEYSLDGRHWQAYTGPFTIHNSGMFDIAYRARDPLAAVEETQRKRVVVDAQGPAISVSFGIPTALAGDVYPIEPRTLLFISAEDAPAGLEKITYRVDGGPEQIYRTPLSRFEPGKVHTIQITAQDFLGNISTKILKVELKDNRR